MSAQGFDGYGEQEISRGPLTQPHNSNERNIYLATILWMLRRAEVAELEELIIGLNHYCPHLRD